MEPLSIHGRISSALGKNGDTRLATGHPHMDLTVFAIILSLNTDLFVAG
jgi:hypothetical protein